MKLPTPEQLQRLSRLHEHHYSQEERSMRSAAVAAYMKVYDEKHTMFGVADETAWDTLHTAPVCIPTILLADGVTIQDRTKSGIVRSFAQTLSSAFDLQASVPFQCMVQAASSRNIQISIAEDVHYSQPISTTLDGEYDAPLLLEAVDISLASGSSATIHDYVQSTHMKAHTVIRVISIYIDDYAQLTYVQDQNWSQRVHGVSIIRVCVRNNAQFNSTLLQTGGLSSSMWIEMQLNGTAAQASMKGISLLSENQRAAYVITQLHNAPATVSTFMLNNLVQDNACVEYRGTAHINECAVDADAAQYNKNMLLAPGARAIAIPNLQARNNQVQCAHGSATGPLDEEHLLYMQARGLDNKAASRLLLHSFAMQGISECNPYINQRVKDYIDSWGE